MDELLVRHFSAQTTEAEESVLNTWKAAHEQEYAVLKKAWTEPRQVPAKHFDAANAWERVARETGQSRPQIVPLNRTFIRYGLAASLLLMIGVFALWRPTLITAPADDLLTFDNQALNAKEVVLPDGSHAWLNQHARLVYNRSLSDIRLMSLSGEAFFEVKKDAAHPFIIAAGQSSVTVLGTSFDVAAGDSLTQVSVATGVVKLSGAQAFVVLNKGEMASASLGTVSGVTKADVNFLAWKTGEFDFDNASLIDLVKSLNTYYKGVFEYGGKTGSNCRITAHFNKSSVEEIGQAIELICHTPVSHKNNKVVIQ